MKTTKAITEIEGVIRTPNCGFYIDVVTSRLRRNSKFRYTRYRVVGIEYRICFGPYTKGRALLFCTDLLAYELVSRRSKVEKPGMRYLDWLSVNRQVMRSPEARELRNKMNQIYIDACKQWGTEPIQLLTERGPDEKIRPFGV